MLFFSLDRGMDGWLERQSDGQVAGYVSVSTYELTQEPVVQSWPCVFLRVKFGWNTAAPVCVF